MWQAVRGYVASVLRSRSLDVESRSELTRFWSSASADPLPLLRRAIRSMAAVIFSYLDGCCAVCVASGSILIDIEDQPFIAQTLSFKRAQRWAASILLSRLAMA